MRDEIDRSQNHGQDDIGYNERTHPASKFVVDQIVIHGSIQKGQGDEAIETIDRIVEFRKPLDSFEVSQGQKVQKIEEASNENNQIYNVGNGATAYAKMVQYYIEYRRYTHEEPEREDDENDEESKCENDATDLF